MALRTEHIQIDSEKMKELDRLAATRQLSRDVLVNEAIDEYLSLNQSHREQIEAGLADFEAGRVTSHASVVEQIKIWRNTD